MLKQIKVLGLLSGLVLSLFSFSVNAQPYLKSRAQQFIIKSAQIIKESHKYIGDIETQKLDGTFDRAVKQQRYARVLFERGEYLNAIHHSDYARRLAFNVYHIKNDFKPKAWEYSANEKSSLQNIPMNNTLDARIEEANPQITYDDLPYLTDMVLYDLEFNDPRP